jgi:putative sterol carrier protein
MSTLQEISAQIKTAVGIDAGLGKSLKLSLKEDGVVFIDGGTVTIAEDMRLP